MDIEKVTIEVPVHKFEVYPEDCKCKLEHDNASKYCKGLGDGWRLPTRNEQLEMYKHKEQLGLKDSYYWSSTESSSNIAWYYNFYLGSSNGSSKPKSYRVRAVRTI
tara:strand:- start:63 stop:380 length:318 start_codon:yes stop_codon:yes gene_type:complete